MTPNYANGKICYLEIPTTDIARSVAFYTAIFGWKTRTRRDGSTAFDDGVGEVSGAWVMGRPSSSAPGLLIYVMVDDVEATSKLVIANGGRITHALDRNAPEWFALFSDPDGNVLGLYQERADS
jgi:predicted enzyme related to lactoylglutathione lyase